MSEPTAAGKKRPAFQFYPGDWRKDVELRSCSVAARGLWIDMLCLAHECDPYGHLVVNGKPMKAAQIAGQVGLTAAQCSKLIDELVSNGVARVADDGTIYSKRMVADETAREARAEVGRANGAKGAEFGHRGSEHGKKGGRPKAENPAGNPPTEPPEKPPQNPRPSSSSSSSCSEEKNPLPPAGGADPAGFARFWETWPSSTRKQGRAKCLEIWRRAGLERHADDIVAHVEAMKASHDWRKAGGEFVPMVSTYLNGRRWDGAEGSHTATNGSMFEGAL